MNVSGETCLQKVDEKLDFNTLNVKLGLSWNNTILSQISVGGMMHYYQKVRESDLKDNIFHPLTQSRCE